MLRWTVVTCLIKTDTTVEPEFYDAFLSMSFVETNFFISLIQHIREISVETNVLLK